MKVLLVVLVCVGCVPHEKPMMIASHTNNRVAEFELVLPLVNLDNGNTILSVGRDEYDRLMTHVGVISFAGRIGLMARIGAHGERVMMDSDIVIMGNPAVIMYGCRILQDTHGSTFGWRASMGFTY